MLGFVAEGAQYFLHAHFGKSEESPWIDNLICTGFENDIAACRFTLTSTPCNDNSDVGVSCVSTPVRLINGGGPWEGRVEIQNNGIWRTVCDTSFGVEEASVICKMLGFKEIYTSPRPKHASLFGQSSSDVRLSRMSCSGTELDVHACIQGTWGHACGSNEEAGVDCRESNIRLTGGSHSMEGRVELLVNGHWSAICDEDWDDIEATIICKTLTAFPFDRQVRGKAFRHSFFGKGHGKIAYSMVKCDGTEIDVMHCLLKDIRAPICNHSNDAAVSCFFDEKIKVTHPDVTAAKGTVLINVDGEWSTMCDTDFGHEEAEVICRELGYWFSSAAIFKSSWFGPGNGTSHEILPQCTGDETKIAFCPLSKSWNEKTCSHTKDVGVQCMPVSLDSDKIRLVGGNQPGIGRLEVYYNNLWGSFCWLYWNNLNTNVVCRMLKYNNANVRSFSIPKNGSAILIGSLQCNGQEPNIGYCKASLDKQACTEEAVGVDCTGGIKVKLNDGTTSLEGRVDIYDGQNWGSLCDNTISGKEAMVICNAATGFRDTHPLLVHVQTPELISNVFSINSLSCEGWENHISQCNFTKTGGCNGHFAHVQCFHNCTRILTTPSGNITSENYPQFYKPHIDCLFIIQPPKGVYKIVIHDLQMADIGDVIEIFDQPNGHLLGRYSIFNGVSLILGDMFYLRYKTNGQDESKGFHLEWSPANAADLVTVNCEHSQWGAAVNLTSLKVLYPLSNSANIVLTESSCYGFIYEDLLFFQQQYSECSSNKSVTAGFVTYTNQLVYLDGKTKQWEVPIQCRKQQTTRIANYHLTNGKRSTENAGKMAEFNFAVKLFYDDDLRFTEEQPLAFNKSYVYQISLVDEDDDLSFNLTSCTFYQGQNEQTQLIDVIQDGRSVSEVVTISSTLKTKIVKILVSTDIASVFECQALVHVIQNINAE